jgi:hypothetical protein
VTRFETYFDAPMREIERVVRRVGLDAPSEAIATAAATVKAVAKAP